MTTSSEDPLPFSDLPGGSSHPPKPPPAKAAPAAPPAVSPPAAGSPAASPPAASPPQDNPFAIVPKDCEGGHGDGVIRRSVPTADVLTGALSRLNRVSLEALLDQLVAAIESCDCGLPEGYPAKEGWFIKLNETILNVIATARTEIMSLRADIDVRVMNEISVRIDKLAVMVGGFFGDRAGGDSLVSLLAKIKGLTAEIEGHDANIRVFEQNITALAAQINVLNVAIADVRVAASGAVNADVTAKIQALMVRLTAAEANIKLLTEKPPVEVIQQVVLHYLSRVDVAASVFNSVKIHVNGAQKTLIEILSILATADHVAQVDLLYSDNDIIGCQYIMADGCVYDFTARFQNLDGGAFMYIFEADWNGLPARFTSTFREVTKTWKVCKKDVTYSSYEPVSHTNILFGLF